MEEENFLILLTNLRIKSPKPNKARFNVRTYKDEKIHGKENKLFTPPPDV